MAMDVRHTPAGQHLVHAGTGVLTGPTAIGRASGLDYAISGIYLGCVASLTVAISWRARRRHRHGPTKPSGKPSSVAASAAAAATPSPPPIDANPIDEARTFYLAEHSAPWWAVAASYFASNIGTDAMVGLASAGATVGLPASWFDIASPLAFLLLAFVALPVYRRSGIFTLPEWAQMRYGNGVRTYLAALALCLYCLNKVAVALYCGSIVLQDVTGAPPNAAIGCLLAFTGLFSALGGLQAVIYVEVVNTVLLLVGGAASIAVAFRTSGVGSWSHLAAAIRGTGPDEPAIAQAASAGLTPSFTHLGGGQDAYSLPALLIGSPWLILWFHLADQEMVQRGLSARSSADARMGTVVGGALKLTVPWMWCLPGILARYALPGELGCKGADLPAHPAGEPCDDANLAYPALMRRLLPIGLRGVLLAASLAGVLSVLASTFNSAATIFAMDLYRPMVNRCSRLQVGRRRGEQVLAADAVADEGTTAAGRVIVTETRGGDGAAAAAACVGEHTTTDRHEVDTNTIMDDASQPQRSAWLAAVSSRASSSVHRRVSAFKSIDFASPSVLVWAGRLFIACLTVLSVLWLPHLSQLSPSLYVAMQSLNAYAAPPVLAAFAVGMVWPGCNDHGALIGMAVGHGLGVLRLVLLLALTNESAAATRDRLHVALSAFLDSQFLYFAAVEGCISVGVMVMVSLATPRRSKPLSAIAHLLAMPALKVAVWWQVHVEPRLHTVMTTVRRRGVAAAHSIPQAVPGDNAAAVTTTTMSRYRRALAALRVREAICNECGVVLRREGRGRGSSSGGDSGGGGARAGPQQQTDRTEQDADDDGDTFTAVTLHHGYRAHVPPGDGVGTDADDASLLLPPSSGTTATITSNRDGYQRMPSADSGSIVDIEATETAEEVQAGAAHGDGAGAAAAASAPVSTAASMRPVPSLIDIGGQDALVAYQLPPLPQGSPLEHGNSGVDGAEDVHAVAAAEEGRGLPAQATATDAPANQPLMTDHGHHSRVDSRPRLETSNITWARAVSTASDTFMDTAATSAAAGDGDVDVGAVDGRHRYASAAGHPSAGAQHHPAECPQCIAMAVGRRRLRWMADVAAVGVAIAVGVCMWALW